MSVFQNLKVYLVPRCIDDARAELVSKLLRENGARLSSYLTDSISVLIADKSDSSEVGEARDIYDIPVVSSQWVVSSARCGFALPHGSAGQLFSPESRLLFVGLVFCPSKVSRRDADLLWAVAISQGAECDRLLTNRTTHLVCASVSTAKYQAVVAKGSNIRIVVPQWIMDCARSGEFLDEAKYHPRLFVDEPEQSSAIEERDSNAAEAIQNLVNTLKLEAQQLDEHHQHQRQQGKHAYHQHGMYAYGAAPATPIASPMQSDPSSPLGPLEPNRFREMVEKQHVAVLQHTQYHHHHQAPKYNPGVEGHQSSGTSSTNYTPPQHAEMSPRMSPQQHQQQQRMWYSQQNSPRPYIVAGNQQNSHGMAPPSPAMLHQGGGPYAQHGSCVPPSSEEESALHSPKVVENSPTDNAAQVYMQVDYYGHPRGVEMYRQPQVNVMFPAQQGGVYVEPVHRLPQYHASAATQPYQQQLAPGQQQVSPRMQMAPQHGYAYGNPAAQGQMQQAQPRRMMNQNAPMQQYPMLPFRGHAAYASQPQQAPQQQQGQPGYVPVRNQQPMHRAQFPIATYPMMPPRQASSERGNYANNYPMAPSSALQQDQYAQSLPSRGEHHQYGGGAVANRPDARDRQQPMRPMATVLPQPQQQQVRMVQASDNGRRVESPSAYASRIAPAAYEQTETVRVAPPPQAIVRPTAPAATPNVASRPQVQYFGHDVRIDVPSELCLIGCTFVIVDYERSLDQREVNDWRTVIEEHGGEVEQAYGQRCTHVICETLKNPVVQQALKENRRCVTAQWLNDCLACKKLLPPWRVAHFPSGYGDNKPCKGRVFSTSGFTAAERNCLKQMIAGVGARYTPYASRSSHLLVAKTLSGRKVAKAAQWKVNVVNLQWLIEVFFGQTSAVQNVANAKYRRFYSKEMLQHDASFDPFRIDPAAVVPLLMNAWRTPIAFGPQTWKTAAKRRYNIEHDDGTYFPYKRIKVAPPNAHAERDEDEQQAINPPVQEVRICFTGFYPAEVANLSQKAVRLGATVVNAARESTHLVTVDLKRSRKLLEAVALGKYVVSAQWILQSYDQRALVDPLPFIAKDEGNENFFGYNLKLSLLLARQRLLFDGVLFYVTPSVLPLPSVLNEIAHTAGGTVLQQWPSCGQLARYKRESVPFVIIACENDLHLCQKMIKAGFDLYSAEFVLTGILRQEMDLQSYKLERRPADASSTKQTSTNSLAGVKY